MTRCHLLVLLSIASSGCGGRAQTIAGEPNAEQTGGTSTGGSSEGGTGAVAGNTSSHAGAVSGGTSSSAGGALAVALQSTRQCVNSLVTGAGLSSCDEACSAVSDCCTGGIYCDESGQWLDPPAACGAPTMSTHCMVSAPDATLSGATPLGPVSLSYAWAEETTGFSTQLVLFFTGSPTAERCEPTSLGFNVATFAQAGAAYIGTSESVALLHVAGKVAYGAATAQIDRKDAAGTHGTLVIDGPGWDFRGEFTAPDCPELDYRDTGK